MTRAVAAQLARVAVQLKKGRTAGGRASQAGRSSLHLMTCLCLRTGIRLDFTKAPERPTSADYTPPQPSGHHVGIGQRGLIARPASDRLSAGRAQSGTAARPLRRHNSRAMLRRRAVSRLFPSGRDRYRAGSGCPDIPRGQLQMTVLESQNGDGCESSGAQRDVWRRTAYP